MLEVKLCTVGTLTALPNRPRYGCLLQLQHLYHPKTCFYIQFFGGEFSSQLHDVWYRESLQNPKKDFRLMKCKTPRTCGEGVPLYGFFCPI